MDECGSQNGNMLWGRIQCILTYGGGSKSILDILINYTLLIVNVVAIGLWIYYMQHNHHDNEDDDDDNNNNNNVPTTTNDNNNNNVAMAAQDPSHRLLSSLSQSSRLDQTASAFTAATTSLVFVTAFQIGLCLAVKCSGISIIWCACIGWYVHKKSKLVVATTITTRQQQGSTTRPGHLQQQQRNEQQQQQRGQQPEHTHEGRTPSQDGGTMQPLTNSSCSSPPQYNNNINNNNNKHDDEDDDENNTTPVLHHDNNDDNNNRTRLVSTNHQYYYSVHGVLEMGLGILNLGVLFYYAWTLEPITTIAHVCAVFLGMVLSMIEPWYYCCGSG